jgi:hypothetical protein
MTFETLKGYLNREYGSKFMGYTIFCDPMTGGIGWIKDDSDTSIFATPNWDGGDVTPFEVINGDGYCIHFADIRFTHSDASLNLKLYFTILALAIDSIVNY